MALAEENSRLAYVALGSNLGDAELTFASVVPRLQALSTTPVIASRWMRSKPVGCPPGSPDFLNGVVGIRPFPGETPESLLAKHPEELLTIPMRGTRSLNLATAVGIVLFEAMRQQQCPA